MPAQGQLLGVLPSVASWKLCNNRALFWASPDPVLRSVTAGSLRDRKRGGSRQSKLMDCRGPRLPAFVAGMQVPGHPLRVMGLRPPAALCAGEEEG